MEPPEYNEDQFQKARENGADLVRLAGSFEFTPKIPKSRFCIITLEGVDELL